MQQCGADLGVYIFTTTSRLLERHTSSILIVVAILISFFETPSIAQELRLDITGRRNPLKENIFPVIYGKIENSQILLGETAYQLQRHDENSSIHPSSNPSKQSNSVDLKSSNAGLKSQRPPVASFLIKNVDDPACTETKHVREVLSLITVLKVEITHLSISTPRETECSRKLAKVLAGQIPLKKDSDSLPDRIRLRLHFSEETIPSGEIKSDVANGDDAETTTSKEGGSPLVLTINGEIIETQGGGWFVYETTTTAAQIISVRKGTKTVFIKSLTPFLFRPGTTERKSSDYRYIYLVTNARTLKASVGPERLGLKDIVDVSIPIFLKLSYGNTRLYPLPGEGKVDRPTILAGIKTHPFFYGMHFDANGFFSYKSGSKIPWTTLITAVMGNDLIELGNNFSVPWGIGVRAFKSKIDSGKNTSDSRDEGDIIYGQTWIPESVLGPAASVGMRYHNSYIYTDATLTVTPLQLPGANLIVTWNPSLWLGYQLTGADTVTLNYQTHDIRYPTATQTVHVTASIVAVGYVRDLR